MADTLRRSDRDKALREAMAMVGVVCLTKPFSTNKKMPGPSYDLPADACRRGSVLARQRDSMCHPKTCYAKRGFFRWGHVREAAMRRLDSIGTRGWADAFAFILDTRYRTTRHFRWHASGDLQSAGHLRDIIRVAVLVPRMMFWLPTHEPMVVASVVESGTTIPQNLVIRISADLLGRIPARWTWPLSIQNLPASMVHYDYGEPPGIPGYKVYECRAHDRDNKCGPCRACWSTRRDLVVSYPRTTPHGVSGTGVRSSQLRIIDDPTH